MNIKNIYSFLSIACITGYIWLLVVYINTSSVYDKFYNICLFKRITNIPCPSCGSSRAILSLLKGNIIDSIKWNPFGIIILTIILVTPLWIIYDTITNKITLYTVYQKIERFLKKEWMAVILTILVLANWIWNILKGL
jgi:hypothetical protein